MVSFEKYNFQLRLREKMKKINFTYFLCECSLKLKKESKELHSIRGWRASSLSPTKMIRTQVAIHSLSRAHSPKTKNKWQTTMELSWVHLQSRQGTSSEISIHPMISLSWESHARSTKWWSLPIRIISLSLYRVQKRKPNEWIN